MARSAVERIRKYKAKYDPEIVYNRWKTQRASLLERYYKTAMIQFNIDEWLAEVIAKYNLGYNDRERVMMKMRKYVFAWVIDSIDGMDEVRESFIDEGYDPEILDEVTRMARMEFRKTQYTRIGL